MVSSPIDRRRFLRAAGVTAVLVVAGEWVGRWLGRRSPAGAVRLAAAGALMPGEARAVGTDVPGREALLVRLDTDTVVAFARRCPHLGCPVLWSGERVRFECPCHRAAFDARTGEVLFGPPRQGLTPMRIVT